MPVRRTDDVPFPSFSLVMSQYLMGDMRLPSCRTPYLLRFHPYPRVKLSNREMMQTIDDRFSALCDVVEDDETSGLESLPLLDLNEEQLPNAVNVPEVVEGGTQPRVLRVSLATLIIDLAVLIARKLSLKSK